MPRPGEEENQEVDEEIFLNENEIPPMRRRNSIGGINDAKLSEDDVAKFVDAAEKRREEEKARQNPPPVEPKEPKQPGPQANPEQQGGQPKPPQGAPEQDPIAQARKEREDLQRERDALAREREEFRRMQEEFQRRADGQAQQNAQGPAVQQEPKKKKPAQKKPEKIGKPEKKPAKIQVQKAQPEARRREQQARRNPYAGTVSAKAEIEEGLLSKGAKDVHKMRYALREATSRFKKVSNEYKAMQVHLKRLDRFMRTIDGRTKLTEAEMETFEKLSMSAYKSTEKYLEKKGVQREERKAQHKKESKGEYEDVRIKVTFDVQERLQDLRKKMYADETKQKREALQKKCDDRMHDLSEDLAELKEAGVKEPRFRQKLEHTVCETLFNINRMSSLKTELGLRPGESMGRMNRRLDRSMNMSEQAENNIKQHDMTKEIFERVVKKLEKGESLTADTIREMQQDYVRKAGRRLAERRLRSQNAPKLSNPEIQADIRRSMSVG